jgi:hypothetical protein
MHFITGPASYRHLHRNNGKRMLCLRREMLAALSDNAQRLLRRVFTDVGICWNGVTIKEAAMLGLLADCMTIL